MGNEEYQKQFIQSGLSTENNGSAHCFLCESPRRLILPGAISGEHKLWKMPIERIKPMQSGLVPCDTSWIPNIEKRKNGMNVIEEEKENVFNVELIKGDLFTSLETSSLCHCVSRDLEMSKGIA